MTASKSILTISRDQPLQSTRTLILEGAGYSVSAALNDEAASPSSQRLTTSVWC